MTGLWSVIIPESAEVTNLVTNPSGETAMTGYTLVSTGSATADTSKSRRGYRSISITCTTAVGDGIIYDSVTLASGTTYTLGFDFWGVNAIPYTAYFADTAGTLCGTATAWTGSAQWTREAVTYAATASANYRLYFVKSNSENAGTIYLDGVGVYALDHDPGHIDGDQDDCWWNGTYHASTSTREAGSAAGGEVTNFDDLSFYVKEFPGSGMAEVEPLLQEIGNLPGMIDAGEKIRERAFSIVGHVSGSSQADLHAKRKTLINAVKSDRVKDKQQVKLVYSGGNSERPTRISAKFIGGLSMGTQDGFTEPIALKFLATNPFWYEDGVEGAAVTISQTVADADYAIRRVDGIWYNISTDFNSYVLAMDKYDGKVYIGGYFTDLGDANGDRIVTWDGSAFASLGTGLNGGCRCIKAAPNGNIYVGGGFSAAGGVANTSHIAYWDTSAAAWKEMSGGCSTAASTDYIEAIAVHNDGSVYMGGYFSEFTDTDGNYISRWSATGWASVGLGMNGVVYALAVGPDGCMYAGGAFTTAGGTTCNAVAKWDGSAWYPLGSGMTGGSAIVYALCFDDAGNLYAGGNFTTAGGVACANVAMWNGTAWSALGSGTNDTVRRIMYGDGLFYIGGAFTTAGGLGLGEGLAVWNGSTWAHVPINYPASSVIYALLSDRDDLYIAGDFTGEVWTSYRHTMTNSGTAIAYPKFEITLDAGTLLTLVYMKNQTTGATMWFDYDIQPGETLTIDCALDKRTVTSNFRGNVIGQAMFRNSDFANFYLLPGINYVSVYCFQYGADTIRARATWPITHWSMDGSAT